MDKYTYALGRRKTSVATIRLFKGKGDSKINGKDVDFYYHRKMHLNRLNKPFTVTDTLGDYYYTAKTKGGGFNGQLDAIVLGLARALEKEDNSRRPDLRKAGLLTRDDRMVERKKTGLRKARKAPQFSKR